LYEVRSGPRADEAESLRAESLRAINRMRTGEEARTRVRFSDFTMAPGEIVTKTWDQRISCKVQAVQDRPLNRPAAAS
jgi:hypothetical protein